jgi:hypothetical protein
VAWSWSGAAPYRLLSGGEVLKSSSVTWQRFTVTPGRSGKAYSSAANLTYLRRRGIQAVIPVKYDRNHRRNRGRAGGRYKQRNTR